MSPFWILLELRMMEVMVTTGATRHAKLQSNCQCHQQTNTQVLQILCQPTTSKHSRDGLAPLKFTRGSSHLVFSLVTSGQGCQASCQPSSSDKHCLYLTNISALKITFSNNSFPNYVVFSQERVIVVNRVGFHRHVIR